MAEALHQLSDGGGGCGPRQLDISHRLLKLFKKLSRASYYPPEKELREARIRRKRLGDTNDCCV